MSETIDLGTYEVRDSDGEMFCRFGDGAAFGTVVQAARALVLDGPLGSAEVWIASAVLGTAAVCRIHENRFEPLGPACTLERRLTLYVEYQPDNFKGYRWGGLDARAGWESTDIEFSEEGVLRLADDCLYADYLTDENDFQSLASDMAQDEEKMASDEWLCVGGEIWCEEPLMALQTARRMAAADASEAISVGKDPEAILFTVCAGGFEVVGGVGGEVPVPEPFAALIAEGW